jgi:hypothetical protein
MSDYSVVLVQKGATVNKCEKCGAIVIDRCVHDTFHALTDLIIHLAENEEP